MFLWNKTELQSLLERNGNVESWNGTGTAAQEMESG